MQKQPEQNSERQRRQEDKRNRPRAHAFLVGSFMSFVHLRSLRERGNETISNAGYVEQVIAIQGDSVFGK